MAVKENTSMTGGEEDTPKPQRVAQTYYIPEEDSDNERVLIAPVGGLDQSPVDPAIKISMLNFDFGFESRPQSAACPHANDSKSSLATTTTAMSTLNQRRYSHGALTVDTSVASSTTSTVSSPDSVCSPVTNTNDHYGWEEELDRRLSVENPQSRELELARRIASGDTVVGPLHEPAPTRPDMKRKSLLYRVLNLRRGLEGPAHPAAEHPRTS
jgi:hypothetical protein